MRHDQLFVDSNLDAAHVGGTPGAPPELTITGDGEVTIYVDGEFRMDGQTTWGEESTVDSLTVYSTDLQRATTFYGFIYTDAVDIAGRGAGEGLTGALVSTADTVEISGNAAITYDESLAENEVQEVEVEFASISYLHITENEISVD